MSFIDRILALGDRVRRDATTLQREFVRRKALVKRGDPLSFILLSQYAYFGLVLPKTRPGVAVFSFDRISKNGMQALDRDSLELMRSILRETEVRCEDYGNALERDGENVVVFLDPPYFDRSAVVYDYYWRTEADYHLLAQRVHRCRHKVLLTVGDHPLMRKLFCGGEYWVLQRAFPGSGYKQGGETWHPELVVANYPLPKSVRAVA